MVPDGEKTGQHRQKGWELMDAPKSSAPLFPRSALLCPAEVSSEERGQEEASVTEISS